MFNLGDLDPRAAYPETGADSLLVVNTLPWPRKVIVDEPEQRGWAAPAGVPEWFFPRDVPWGGFRPETPYRRVAGEVPGAWLRLPAADLGPGEDDLEDRRRTRSKTRITASASIPATGALAEWFDKALGHDFAGKYQGWGLGQYVYERVESDEDRQALFWGDFSAPDFGYGRTDTPWQRWTVESAHGQRTGDRSRPRLDRSRGQRARVSAAAVASTRWRAVRNRSQSTGCSTSEHQTGIEAVFIAFPFNLGAPSFRADINGIPFSPNEDQLDGTVTRLVSARALGRRQRWRARRHPRPARRAARPSRRHHDREMGPRAGA